MVRYLLLVTILLSVTISQTREEKEKNKPCNSTLIIQAKKDGMRSIKRKEIPQYLMDLWKCRKMKKGKITLKRINDKTLEKDFEKSEKFTGFTATLAYCTTMTVIIFYIFKLISK